MSTEVWLMIWALVIWVALLVIATIIVPNEYGFIAGFVIGWVVSRFLLAIWF